MRRPMLKLCSVVAVVGLVAVGCGSDKKKTTTNTTAASSGSSTTAASSGGSGEGGNAAAAALVKNDPLTGAKGSGKTRGITSTSIKIGCEFNGTAFAGADDGYKARFERANRDNELGGRKINFTPCQDDGENTQNNLTIAKRLVEQDQVFAVMSISANQLPGTTDYLNAQEVPYFGWGFLPGFCATRWGFGFNGCLVSGYQGAAHTVYQSALADPIIKSSGLAAKDIKVGIQQGDDDSGKFAKPTYQKIWTAKGATVVYNETSIPVPGPPADFTPFVQATLKANPNVVVTSTAFTDVGGYSAALAQGGFKGKNYNFVAYVPGLLGTAPQLAAALEGTYIDTQIVPQEQQTDWIKQIETDLVAVNAKAGKLITLAESIAYGQAEMLVEQLKAVGKDLNTKTFDEKVNGGSFTFSPPQAGALGSIAFPAGHFIAADCAAIVKVENKTYKVDQPFACYPSVIG